ncbi:MAG: hypothetical protein GF418_00280 [Chitinivibrionales bacterium]|nr:hypothetical protein [Chitinivibrionales bacterium]MBD3394036.1 hypothetical protein [Chitinivibrionales bacterium]
MAYWIKRFAWIVGTISFFAVFFTTLDRGDPLALDSILQALLKGTLAASLFWFVGFVAGDILFKGVIQDVASQEDNLVDGGLLQRVEDMKKETGPKPSGAEEPAQAVKPGTAKP